MLALIGTIGLGVRRVIGRLTGPTPGRTLLSVGGVAAAIAVLVIISGVSLGMATKTTVKSEDVNIWITPENDVGEGSPFAFEGARLGEVHQKTENLSADGRIKFATPVLVQPLRLYNPEVSKQLYVLAIGVIPGENRKIAGIDVSSLDGTYPYYANGNYNGTWTGELIVSETAASELELNRSEKVGVGGSEREFKVVDIAREEVIVGIAEIPVVVGHLAELQSVTGMSQADQADQILVATTDRSVLSDMKGRFPGASVITRSGLAGVSATPTNLPFAMAIAAGVIALGVGTAFVATTMGLELTASRRSLAIIEAIGFSRARVGILLATETITIAILGGIVGIGVGSVGIIVLNASVSDVFNVNQIAVLNPLLVVYGLGAALAVGLLSILYPIFIAWKTEILEEITV